MNPIIGFHGPIGSGKDTLANMLIHRLSGHKLKFADPLYAACQAIDPIINPFMTHASKDFPLLGNPSLGTRRNLLEKMGTEFFRNIIHPEFFLLYLASTIDSIKQFDPDTLIVISDVRFDNEADKLRELGGHIIHLIPDWPCARTGHASDAGITFCPGDTRLLLEKDNVEGGYKKVTSVIADQFGSRLPQIR